MSDSPTPPSAAAGSAREVLWAFLRSGLLLLRRPHRASGLLPRRVRRTPPLVLAKRATRRSSPWRNRCPARPAARWASPWDCCAPDGWAGSPRGSDSPCPRRCSCWPSPWATRASPANSAWAPFMDCNWWPSPWSPRRFWPCSKSLAPDALRMALALLAAAMLSYFSGQTVLAIAAGALLRGLAVAAKLQSGQPKSPGSAELTPALASGLSRRAGVAAGAIFCALLLLLPVAASISRAQPRRPTALPWPTPSFAAARWSSAEDTSLLPLLERAVVARGWVDQAGLPQRIRRRAGRPRPAVHLRRLPGRRRSGPRPSPGGARRAGAGGNLSPRTAPHRRRAALLERAAPRGAGCGAASRGECRRGWNSAGGLRASRLEQLRFTRPSIWLWLWPPWPCWCASSFLPGCGRGLRRSALRSGADALDTVRKTLLPPLGARFAQRLARVGHLWFPNHCPIRQSWGLASALQSSCRTLSFR